LIDRQDLVGVNGQYRQYAPLTHMPQIHWLIVNTSVHVAQDPHFQCHVFPSLFQTILKGGLLAASWQK
jgi:hypothetical protein